MAKNKSGNKTWITGAVLGAVAGAAYALWKTPMSGEELRAKLSTGPVAQRDEVRTDAKHTPNMGDKLMSKVEHTLAPIVGVKLGKTANGPAPANGAVTEPISVATPATEMPVAEPAAAAPVQPDPAFRAAEATPDPGRNVTQGSDDSIRAKRFAWGSPTPEAGIQPVPAEPLKEDPVTEPAMAREPAAPAQVVPPGDTGGGNDTIRAKRFSWGEPAPDAVTAQDNGTDKDSESNQPLTDQLATAGSTTVGDTSPVEAVSTAAMARGSNLRQFPALGGLEKS